MTRDEVKRVIGYTRVSTAEQGASGAGLKAQEQTIRLTARLKGWQVVRIATDVASAKSINGRRALDAALADLKGDKADALVVAKLDRLSRSVADFAKLLAMARKQRWHIIVADMDIDTSSITGKLVVNILVSLSEWEREMIGLRTKDALAAVKARGVKLGRERIISPSLERRIRRLKASGLSYERCSSRLNAEGIPAPGGGSWYWTTIRLVVNRSPRQ